MAKSCRFRSPVCIGVIRAIRLLIFTGGRIGKTLKLKWDCIDFEHKRINLADGVVRAKGLRQQVRFFSLQLCAIPSVISTVRPRSPDSQ